MKNKDHPYSNSMVEKNDPFRSWREFIDISLILGKGCSYFLHLSAGTGKLCILDNLGLVFIWSCFVSCLLFPLFYVSLRNLCSGTHRMNYFLLYSLQDCIRDLEASRLTLIPRSTCIFFFIIFFTVILLEHLLFA